MEVADSIYSKVQGIICFRKKLKFSWEHQLYPKTWLLNCLTVTVIMTATWILQLSATSLASKLLTTTSAAKLFESIQAAKLLAVARPAI